MAANNQPSALNTAIGLVSAPIIMSGVSVEMGTTLAVIPEGKQLFDVVDQALGKMADLKIWGNAPERGALDATIGLKGGSVQIR
jgi:hypothetical protein